MAKPYSYDLRKKVIDAIELSMNSFSVLRLFETCSIETDIWPIEERVALTDSCMTPAPPEISEVAAVVDKAA